MPTITVLPHEDLCPEGCQFQCKAGAALCVCTTCHVLIRKGFESLRAASDQEEDQLGKAWGLEACSRLSCQVRVSDADLVVEIPRYTLNIVSEHR
jgi:ferredoxin, 2Fe-2S